MTRRTLAQWKPIIEDQLNSGLTSSAFCKKHGLNYKSFLGRKAALAKATQRQCQSTQLISLNAPIIQQSSLCLEMGSAKLNIPADIDTVWLTRLLKGLSK